MLIHLRGGAVYASPPPGLVGRLVDYVVHVLATLSLLVKSPGKTTSPAAYFNPFFWIEVCHEQAQ
jgi:hypothetical protein